MQLLLRSHSTRVQELVDLLQVSEVTIRTDLRRLEAEGKLIRTHGGATLGNIAKVKARAGLATGQAAATSTPSDHLRIAQRAALLVEDGDSILLVNHEITRLMVDELLKLKMLTVITHGLQIALTLKRSRNHKIILVGGQLQEDSDSLDGTLSAGLRAQKAFLACDGLDSAHGAADDDILIAQFKTAACAVAGSVIALVPADRLGRAALMSFAPAKQLAHIITTEGASEAVLTQLRADGAHVWVCGDRVTSLPITGSADQQKFRIGFANLDDQQEFAVAVRHSIERAGQALGNIELILADNAADPEIALANTREMLAKKVDLIVQYQMDERTNYVIMDLTRSAGIPVIGVDIPLPGATFFGADNYRAGHIAGDAAVAWIRRHWHAKIDKIVCLEQPESGPVVAMRIEGHLDSLRAAFPLGKDDIMRCETRGDPNGSQHASVQALRKIPWGRKVLFIGINANSTLGALGAIESLGRHEHSVVVGQSASLQVRRELARGNPCLIGAVDYSPNRYGEAVLSIARDLLSHKPTPPALYTEHRLLTSENVHKLYPADGG